MHGNSRIVNMVNLNFKSQILESMYLHHFAVLNCFFSQQNQVTINSQITTPCQGSSSQVTGSNLGVRSPSICRGKSNGRLKTNLECSWKRGIERSGGAPMWTSERGPVKFWTPWGVFVDLIFVWIFSTAWKKCCLARLVNEEWLLGPSLPEAQPPTTRKDTGLLPDDRIT